MDTALNTKVGVLGGGQLGRMMGYAAGRLGIHLAILDPMGTNSPAGRVCPAAVAGHFNEADKVMELAKQVDLVTVEIEHINCDALVALEKQGKVRRVRGACVCARVGVCCECVVCASFCCE
jgi:phosphoribosylaminoimidazole carboxylase (NCAIR synthetase)